MSGLWQVPSIVQERDNFLRYLVLGDVTIALHQGVDTQVLTDARINTTAPAERARADALPSGSGFMTVLQTDGPAPPGTPYNLVMRLDRKFIIPGAELDGETTVLFKMARKMKPDDKELVIDMPGMVTMGAELRRTMTESAETGTLAVQGPGAIVVPIAIYR
jgi:hypothetical protein